MDSKKTQLTGEPDDYVKDYRSHGMHMDSKRDMDSKHDIDSKRDMDSKHNIAYGPRKDSEPDLPPPSYDAGHVGHSSAASSSQKSMLCLMILCTSMYQRCAAHHTGPGILGSLKFLATHHESAGHRSA